MKPSQSLVVLLQPTLTVAELLATFLGDLVEDRQRGLVEAQVVERLPEEELSLLHVRRRVLGLPLDDALAGLAVEAIAHNVDFAAGQASSLQVGLAAGESMALSGEAAYYAD